MSTGDATPQSLFRLMREIDDGYEPSHLVQTLAGEPLAFPTLKGLDALAGMPNGSRKQYMIGTLVERYKDVQATLTLFEKGLVTLSPEPKPSRFGWIKRIHVLLAISWCLALVAISISIAVIARQSTDTPQTPDCATYSAYVNKWGENWVSNAYQNRCKESMK